MSPFFKIMKAGDSMLQKKERNEINTITSEIVDSVIELLKNDVYKIVLYGSYAREDFDIGSDIDIMILLNCNKEKVSEYRFRINKLASRASLKNDIEISILLRDRETFEQSQDILPFYKNIKNEGVVLYG